MTHQRPSREVSAAVAEDIATATPLVPTWSIDFTQQSPAEAGIIFTRASNAGYYDKNGNWVIALTNTLRINHNPVTGLPYGFLSEGQRTNYLRNSAAPATQTISLTAGTYTLQTEGSGSCTVSAGTATGTDFGSATAASPRIFTLTTSGTVVFTVSGALTRFQCENGNTATSFIATEGAAATRSADVASVPFSGIFNQQGGTLAYVAGASGIAGGNSVGLDDNTGSNNTYINQYVRNTLTGMFFRLNGIQVADHKLYVNRVIGSPSKVAFTYGPHGTRFYINTRNYGSSSVSTANANIVMLRIGHRNEGASVSHINEHVQRVDYFNTVLTPTQLQQLTA